MPRLEGDIFREGGEEMVGDERVRWIYLERMDAKILREEGEEMRRVSEVEIFREVCLSLSLSLEREGEEKRGDTP